MSVVSELLAGVGLLGRGLGLVLRRPRLFLLGAIPPLITSVLFTGVIIALATELDPLVGWLTPFASSWSAGLATTFRVLVGLALLAGAALLMVITFSGLTLALGAPLYDKISESVQEELGHVPSAAEEPLARSVVRAVRQTAALVAVSLGAALVLFGAGFVPVLGQTVVPVVSVVFGGWMLAIELVGSSFERHGRLRIADRRTALRRRRARVLGLAVPTFLLLAVPFVAVVVFPVATAAGTLLARDLLEPTDTPAGGAVSAGPAGGRAVA